MCGRYTLKATPSELAKLMPLFDGLDLQPSYNVAPCQNVLAARAAPNSGNLEAVLFHWGLIPSWADDPKIGYKLINARAETAREKPSFRSAFKNRHCLVIADGFYEWKKEGKAKVPFHIRMRDGQPFAFAGLWEKWEHDDKKIESCTILTTEANPAMRQLHDRMPVIVDRAHFQHWLTASGASDPGDFEYLAPYPADKLTAVAVNPIVNNARNNTPACLEEAVPRTVLF